MTPTMCRSSSDSNYGDCARACIATMLDIPDADVVPHFYFDGDARRGMDRMVNWLLERNWAPFFVHYDGSIPLETVLEITGEQSPHVTYMLIGDTRHGPHAVVCKGKVIAHDPAWVRSPIVGPSAASGIWSLMVITRL